MANEIFVARNDRGGTIVSLSLFLFISYLLSSFSSSSSSSSFSSGRGPPFSFAIGAPFQSIKRGGAAGHRL